MFLIYVHLQHTEKEKKILERRQARSLAWVSCNGVRWLFVGAGSDSLALLVFCCVVYSYGVGAKIWHWNRGNNEAKFSHFFNYCFLKLLVVFWMFYLLSFISGLGLFSACIVIGYTLGLWGELLCGEFKDKFI